MTREKTQHHGVVVPTRGVLVALGVLALLIGIGIWRGDFGETRRNGTTL